MSGQAAGGGAWLIGTDEGWYEAVLVASDNFLPTRRHFKFVKFNAAIAAMTLVL